MVLLHSSGLSGRQWRRLAGAVAGRGLRAVAVDFAGHGSSEPWPEGQPFSFRTDVEAVRALLGEHAPAHVVGHSCTAGLSAALRAGCAGVRTVDGSVRARGLRDARRRRGCRCEGASLAGRPLPWGVSPGEHEAWLQAFVDYWGGDGAWNALREEARSEFRRVGWVVREGVRSLTEDRTPASAYRSLSLPVRILTGELSPIAAGRVAKRLGEAIAGADVVTIAGAGHMAPLTDADRVNARILEILTP